MLVGGYIYSQSLNKNSDILDRSQPRMLPAVPTPVHEALWKVPHEQRTYSTDNQSDGDVGMCLVHQF